MSEIHKKYLMLSGVILLALTFGASTGTAQAVQDGKIKDIVDDIKPYEGSTGPGSFLYGLKIAIENTGEAFTFNESEKVKKQVEHAELRIAEAKAELKKNNTEAANRALERYREKIQATDDRLTGLRRNEPELLDAQERIIKHQLVLRRLQESQPDNRGLEIALNNSMRLEEKFELRTKVKLEREIEDNPQMVRVREIEIEEKEIETEIENNAAKVKVKVKFIAGGVDRDVIEKEILEKIKLGKDDIGKLMAATPAVTGTPGAMSEEELKVRVESGRSVSEVEVEFRFRLNTVNRNEIVNGIAQKLSLLKMEDLQKAQIEVKDRRDDRREDRRDDRRQDRREDRRAGEAGDDRGGSTGGSGGDDRGSSGGGGSGGGSSGRG